MKLLFAVLIVLSVGTAAFAQGAGTVQDNQSIPPIVVPKIVIGSSVGGTVVPDRTEYAYGQPTHLRFTITNHSKGTVNYEFSSAQMFDIVISDNTGKPVWHWAKDKVFNQLITHLNLADNQSMTYNVTWNQRDDDDHPVPPGAYSVYAEFLPMSRPEVTGNLIANSDNDPVNTGMPTSSPVESGAVNIKNTTPGIYAKTTFKILPGS